MILNLIKRLFRKKNSKKRGLRDGHSLDKMLMSVNQLTIGMYVVELDRPWLETDFLFQGFEIKSEAELIKLKETCNFVYIDTTKNRFRRNAIKNSSDKEIDTTLTLLDYPPPPEKLGAIEVEINRADRLYKDTGKIVADFMDRIARGEGVDTQLAKQAVAECVDSILHSPDAFLWLSQLKRRDEYTAQHSLNVCVLSIVLGRHIGLSHANLNNVGLCGMMHDMGKMLVPLEILNKPGKLDNDEMEIMQSHTTLGHELLKSSNGMYQGAIKTALSHHERLDGKGYPHRVSHRYISHFTRIVTIADLYDAITSDRCYQKGRTHLEATHILAELANSHLDEALVIKFIECIGVYPPGCLVELTNGDIGIVVEINDKLKLRPKVLLILDRENNPQPEKVIDLATMPVDENDTIYTIRRIVKAEEFGIDSAKYYQQGVLQKGFALGKQVQNITTRRV